MEIKVKATRQVSTHAATAKAIRIELKKNFPSTVFSVQSDSFVGGNSVSIEWVNGLTNDNVTDITAKYQYGHFDCMTDFYDHTNRRNDIPQVKYVQTRREVSEDIRLQIFEECKKTYDGWANLKSLDENNLDFKDQWGVWSARDYIYRLMVGVDLTMGYEKDKIFL
jgi:hypothetical protein